MRTLNKKHIYFVLLEITGLVSYGFIANHSSSVSYKKATALEAGKSGQKKSLSMTPPPPPPSDLVGIWEDQNEPGHKLEFSADGEIKIYSENVVVNQSFYQISNTCDGQTYDGGYLKIIDPADNSETCMLIFGINEEGSNVMSLMTDTGHMQVYEKQ